MQATILASGKGQRLGDRYNKGQYKMYGFYRR